MEKSMLRTVLANRIELGFDHKNFEIYESFYFRGNLEDSPYSFWLKHNLIQMRGQSSVRVDNILVLFNETEQKTKTYQQTKTVTLLEYQTNFLKKESWRNLRVDFENQGYFELTVSSDDPLCGTLSGYIPNQVKWSFELSFSNVSYYHFNRDWFYQGFFPKKKILTSDCFVSFVGHIQTLGESSSVLYQGNWKGMNGHNWGKEHALQYAYTNTNELTVKGVAEPQAFFDCFSAKIKIGRFRSPYLSAGSLFYRGQWYHFNSVMKSFMPQVREMTLKSYEVIFKNDEYILEVKINGDLSAWVTLSYDHPSYRKSDVHNCKRAVGKFILKKIKDQSIIAQLESQSCELEVLMSDV